ncbi:MAG: GntR family transcriptional regulator [Victivallaceae bacterium]|nr:GntR family transcriptional regulator [Victivallaceae bacterium]
MNFATTAAGTISLYLIRFIINSKGGETIPSENELCKMCKVSRPTVRKVIKEYIAQGALQAKQGKGVFVNPNAVLNLNIPEDKKRLVGIINRDGKSDYYNYGNGMLYTSVFSRLLNKGIFVTDLKHEFSFDTAISLINKIGLSGIIWMFPDAESFDLIAEIERQGVPVVTLGACENENFNRITIDYRHAGYLAAEYLIKKGHKKIAFVGYREKRSFISQYLAGFRAAHDKHGIRFDSSLIVNMFDDIFSKVSDFLKDDTEVTAFFAVDYCAIPVFQALESHGLLNKYPVICRKNTLNMNFKEFKSIDIEYPYTQAGRTAADTLFKLIDNKSNKTSRKTNLNFKPKLK